MCFRDRVEKVKYHCHKIKHMRDVAQLVLIESDVEGYEYFTHGGTVTLVEYCDKIYGLTAKHVLDSDKAVDYKDICMTNTNCRDYSLNPHFY